VALFYGYGQEHLAKLQKIFVRIFGEYSIAKDDIDNITATERLNRLRLFNEGDAVEVVGGVKGTVQEIQDYHTILITFDKQTVIIPNTMIVSNKIINYKAEPNRRIDLIFGIGYDDDLLKAKLILQEIIKGSDFVLDDPAPLIGVKELADSSVNFLVRIYVRREYFARAPLEITEQVKLKFDEAKIGIPYPQQEIHLHQVK
jgi:small conductance mechanosensitive channel